MDCERDAALVAGAGKCFVEPDADCARVGLFPLTVPGERRDWILWWLRQRVLPGGC